MLYSHCIYSRKGPLGAVWVAAYCHKNLKKDQVNETDISSSVDEIMLKEITVTYRVLGYLLLGVVRIYSKKVEYLYHDCNKILTKIGALSKKDNPITEPMCASYFSITLPDKFELDAFNLEISEDVSGGNVKPHQRITLEETWEDAGNEHYSLDMYHHEDFACFETSSDVYTPVEDVLSLHMMDIDLVVSPSHNLTCLEASMEKLQGDQLPQEECLDVEMLCGANEPLDLSTQFNEVYDQAKWIRFLEITPPDSEKSHAHMESYPITTTVEGTPDESKFPHDSGGATPEFMVIHTPAKKEQLRISRKIKHLFDETMVLSNRVVRQSIHSSSSLVGKRRKAPQTALDVWRACKISNLCQDFMEPLIPCISFHLNDLFYKKNLKTPEPVEVVAGTIKSGDEGLGTPTIYSELKSVFEENSVNHSASMRFFESPTTSKTLGSITSVTNMGDGPSTIENQALDLNLMDEMGPHEDQQSSDGWSVRTRTVARYLRKSFLNRKEQREEEVLSLAPVLEEMTRKECARLFYEILVLKSGRFLDVKQDAPYGDILLLKTPQIEVVPLI